MNLGITVLWVSGCSWKPKGHMEVVNYGFCKTCLLGYQWIVLLHPRKSSHDMLAHSDGMEAKWSGAVSDSTPTNKASIDGLNEYRVQERLCG